MKIKTTFALLFLTSLCFGQIPNPSFENWTGTQPDGWMAYRTNPFSPFIFETINTNAHNGAKAVQSDIVLTGPIYNPSGLFSGNQSSGFYFPITTKPTKLKGWYILQTNGLDTFTVNVTMKKQGAIIGQGEFTSTTTNLNYAQFSANINYTSAVTPDSMKIIISFNHATAGSGHAGSYFILDDLTLDQTIGVEDISNEPTIQFSPNPAQNKITITQNTDQQTNIKLFDLNGAIIHQWQLNNTSQTFDISPLTNGIYWLQFEKDGTSYKEKLVIAH